VAFSGATCLARSPIGAVFETPETLAFLRRVVGENLAVAEGAGQGFAAGKAESIVALFRGLPHATKSSMLIDLEAGKPLEMPWLQGRMLEIGRAQGIETPAISAVVAALAPHAGGRRAERGAGRPG
jgi:2-dehydropantoate 2-reductase